MHLSRWAFLKGQFKEQPPVVKADLAGKTICVVGANTGLGFEATKQFAAMNPERIILACRSEARGQAAVKKLEEETGYTKGELWIVDLGDFASVKHFGERFEKDGGRLDTLIANAGISTEKYETTKDGWESTLQVNCLATNLLTLLLLPSMLRTATRHSTVPRIVVVSSETHYWAEFDKKVRETRGEILKTLGSAAYCTPKVMRGRYFLTKLFNVFFVRSLNARLGPSAPVIVDALNPGFCHSEMNRNLSWPVDLIVRLVTRLVAFPTEVGGRRLVFAAVGLPQNADSLRGEYINGYTVEEVCDFAMSAEGRKAEEDIWDEMMEILGKVDPKVLETQEKYLKFGAQ
ncbi:hypothetical protein C8J57DRAFT_572775 [Mycena rebaudengoi]|nr:hypothetical protein C8J57DRAFT_572775 [Mycena rebaudengoi]